MLIWTKRIALTALLLYLGAAAFAYIIQRKALYFPPDYYHSPPAEMAEIRTASGGVGWHSPAAEGRPTVMVFHGNASSIDSNLHIFRALQAEGFGVWSVGYPGYPGTEGRPTQPNLTEAAIEQYDHLSNMGIQKIAFPFNSVSDMAKRQVPFLPTSILLKDTWRSDEALRGLNMPLIWIHGTADGVIPVSQGEKLYTAYTGPKTSLVISGANHINTWLNGGSKVVLEALNKL